MELTIYTKDGGIIIDKYSNLTVTLVYDSVCSTFSFDIYWDPQDYKMRQVMLPGAYNQCTVKSNNGELLITGVLLSPSFKSGATKFLVNISGYSRTGVFQDCEYMAAMGGSTQSNNKTLFTICDEISRKFGIATKIEGPINDTTTKESEVTLIGGLPITQSDCNASESIMEYLSDISKDSNVVLSHNKYGELTIKVAGRATPIFNFTNGMPGFIYELSFNGEQMHSTITAFEQGGATPSQPVTNPYVLQPQNHLEVAFNSVVGQAIANVYNAGFRPHSVIKSAKENGSIQDTANQALASELKGVSLTISMIGWTLNNKIVRPGQYITVQNPELYLFKPATFFIESVDFSGDAQQETAVLNCVLPECYTDDIEKGNPLTNIFTANNNNNTFETKGLNPDNKNRSKYPTPEFNPNLDL